MDTIIGKTQSEAILTITERKINFIMIKKLPMGRGSKAVSKVVYKMLLPFCGTPDATIKQFLKP